MRINIIHHNKSSDVIIDAQTLDYVLRKCKEKKEVKHLMVNNTNIEDSTINIFLDTFNNILFEKAKMNIFIINQHKFHKNWIYVLDKFDYIICKTKYCYETVKQYVTDINKLKYFGWRSYDCSHSMIDKEKDEWLLFYNDNDYLNVQSVIDIWTNDYPVLNIVFSGVDLKKLKRKNLPNINYIEDISEEKFEILFNRCLVHLCLNDIDNYNSNVSQCLMVKSVPIILDKGPVLEIVNDDCCFKVSSTKKKLKNSLGSYYKYDIEELKNVIKKVHSTSGKTLEIMGNTGAQLVNKNNMIFSEKCVSFMRDCFKQTLDIKRDKKEIKDNDLPTVSLVTTVCDAHSMFKLPRLNYMSTSYPQDKIEWIVVDDSQHDTKVEDLLPPEDRREQFKIKYVRLNEKHNIGAKLNIALEHCSNDVVLVMNYDDFFYQNSIKLLVTKLLKSSGSCVGVTSFGCFDINRYISIINVEHMIEVYYNRIYTGGLTFYRDYWLDGNKFNEEVISKTIEGKEDHKLDVLDGFFDDKYSSFNEISWENIIVGLIHKGNNMDRIIDERQEPNGCHFKFSKKVFDFVCSLDGEKKELVPEQQEQVNNSEVKEI